MTAEMFDSIDPSQIPAGRDDAGYVDGRWRTFSVLHGPHNLSVAVFSSDDADALDDEPGDATNAQAPGWVRRELGLGHWRPCLLRHGPRFAVGQVKNPRRIQVIHEAAFEAHLDSAGRDRGGACMRVRQNRGPRAVDSTRAGLVLRGPGLCHRR